MMDLTQDQAKRDARDMKKAKSDALKEAVLSKTTENPISPPTTPPNDSVGRLKSAEGTNINNHWLELYKERDIDLSPFRKFIKESMARCFQSYTASTTRTSQTMTTGRHVF
jgi:hypothetical protein